MNTVTVQFLGSGDAFGSGGRLQTCILVSGQTRFLLDCGPSVLIGFNQHRLDPNQVTTIFLTHLHGDHAAGLPFFILDAQFRNRQSPLTIVGPLGTAAWYEQVMETLFPHSFKTVQKFPLQFQELMPGKVEIIQGIKVEPFAVVHAAMTALALRLEFQHKIITFSGDTEWTDALIAAAHNADFFIVEAYSFDKKIKNHLDYTTIKKHTPDFAAKKIVLTHMSEDTLSHLAELDFDTAADGKIFIIE